MSQSPEVVQRNAVIIVGSWFLIAMVLLIFNIPRNNFKKKIESCYPSTIYDGCSMNDYRAFFDTYNKVTIFIDPKYSFTRRGSFDLIAKVDSIYIGNYNLDEEKVNQSLLNEIPFLRQIVFSCNDFHGWYYTPCTKSSKGIIARGFVTKIVLNGTTAMEELYEDELFVYKDYDRRLSSTFLTPWSDRHGIMKLKKNYRHLR